jgi:hypothetical protein
MLNFLKNKISLLFLAIIFLPYFAQAQLDNRLLEERIYPNSEQEGELWLKFRNYNFLRNNEYFNPIVSGETLLGSQLSSSLMYQPLPNVQIEAGIFLSRDFGGEDFSQISPLFRLTYQKDSTKIIFGNLQANYTHRLIEPMYGFERGITRRLEQGLQFIRHRPKWYSELWIDWQEGVPSSKDSPEIFWVGFVNEWTLVKKNNFSLSLPLQATIRHTGGQDLVVPILLGNELNASLGLKIHQDFSQDSFVKKLYAEVYTVFSSEQYSGPSEISRSGQGFYPNIGLNTRWFNFLGSFWQGNEFNSTQGGDLYKSFSQRGDGIFQAKRDLLFLRFFKDWVIQRDLSLSLRAEPYYDIQNELWEFNAGFYITYRPAFRLGNISRKK